MENSSTFHFAVLVSFWVSVKLWDISPNIHKSEKELLHVFFWKPIFDQRHYFANKGLCSQSYGFSSSVCMYGWCMDVRIVLWRKLSTEELMLLNCGVREDSWESLGLQIQLVYPKGNQPWTFIGRTDAEAETPILWSPDAKNWLIGKDPDAGKDWRREEKETTEDEMVGWHHWFNGCEVE